MGVAESICTSLAQLPGLEVTSREKLLREMALVPETDPRTIGLKIGCRWSVTGHFQKIGMALRFTIRLADVVTDEVNLAEQVTGNCEDVFELKDRLAALVSDKFTQLKPSPATRVTPRPQLSAYECYVRGRQAWVSYEKGHLDQAKEWFERAVDIEPEYAPALAGLAAVTSLRFTYTTDSTALDIAEEYARRAIDADSQLSEPHVWLGYVHCQRGDLESAYEEQQRAIRLDPNNVYAHYFAACFVYGNIEAARKKKVRGETIATDAHPYRREKGLELFQRALELDQRLSWAWLGAGT